MVTGTLGNNGKFVLHCLGLLLGDNLQRATMTGTLEGKVASIDNLSWVQFLIGIFTLTAGRNAVSQLTFAITFRQWGLIVCTIVPDDIARWHITTSTETELNGT